MRILFTFIMFFYAVYLAAQSVFPAYEDQPLWCVQRKSFPSNEIFYYNLKLKPDTLLCNKTYSPVVATSINNSTGENVEIVKGYIRQEGKRVFQLTESCEELLIQDFSLEVGDSIAYYFFRG